MLTPTHCRRSFPTLTTVVLVGLACVLAGAGLVPARAAQPSTDAPRKSDAPQETARDGGWSIVLTAFRGDDAQQLAQQTLALLASTGQVRGAVAVKRGPAIVITVGSYSSPSDPAAHAELQRIRDLEIKGEKPFAGAFLTPPDGQSAAGSRPEYNLVRARDQFGKRARFTLQVGVYGPTDRKPTAEEQIEARKAAEQAAATLRREGELAFYFHGPNLSMVTIGVFSDDDVARPGDPKSGTPRRDDAPTLASLKRRFPNNLVNGAPMKVTTKIGTKTIERVQESQLVVIPDR